MTKECSTPPSEAVLWEVYKRAPENDDYPPRYEYLAKSVSAKGAYEAWRVSGVLVGYGSCWVANLWTPVDKVFPKNHKTITEAQKRARARAAIIQPKTAENRRR